MVGRGGSTGCSSLFSIQPCPEARIGLAHRDRGGKAASTARLCLRRDSVRARPGQTVSQGVDVDGAARRGNDAY